MWRKRLVATRDVADFAEAAGGPRVAHVILPVVPLVAVSGADFVEALALAGFAVRSRSDSATVIECGPRALVVPDVAMLVPEDLLALLHEAGIEYDTFLDLLSETPTDPDLRRPALRRPSAP
jgi:hypothetical protein